MHDGGARLRRQIGGGIGLDEAELARSAPLDGEPWTDDVIDDEESKP